jgi:hypothetical protein
MRFSLIGQNQKCTGRLGVGENQSRRDPAKVAQYEVLGKRFLRPIRPGRDDRSMLAIAERRARPKAECFDRPLRDGRVFLHHFPVRQLPDTGLLSLSPCGASPQRTILRPYVDAHAQPRILSRHRLRIPESRVQR